MTDLREIARHTLLILPAEAQGVIGDGGEGEREDGSVEAGDDAENGEQIEPRIGANIRSIHECEDEEPTGMNVDGEEDKE